VWAISSDVDVLGDEAGGSCPSEQTFAFHDKDTFFIPVGSVSEPNQSFDPLVGG
jgi:hypothetical protein